MTIFRASCRNVFPQQLCDFGFSKLMPIQGCMLSTGCGSLCYSPPELFAGAPYIGEHVRISSHRSNSLTIFLPSHRWMHGVSEFCFTNCSLHVIHSVKTALRASARFALRLVVCINSLHLFVLQRIEAVEYSIPLKLSAEAQEVIGAMLHVCYVTIVNPTSDLD